MGHASITRKTDDLPHHSKSRNLFMCAHCTELAFNCWLNAPPLPLSSATEWNSDSSPLLWLFNWKWWPCFYNCYDSSLVSPIVLAGTRTRCWRSLSITMIKERCPLPSSTHSPVWQQFISFFLASFLRYVSISFFKEGYRSGQKRSRAGRKLEALFVLFMLSTCSCSNTGTRRTGGITAQRKWLSAWAYLA